MKYLPLILLCLFVGCFTETEEQPDYTKEPLKITVIERNGNLEVELKLIKGCYMYGRNIEKPFIPIDIKTNPELLMTHSIGLDRKQIRVSAGATFRIPIGYDEMEVDITGQLCYDSGACTVVNEKVVWKRND